MAKLGIQSTTVRPVLPVDFAAAATDQNIALTWDDAAADYEFGEIDVSLDEETYTKLTEFNPGQESFDHVDLVDETEYFYRLRVYKRGKWSVYLYADDQTDPL